MAIILGYGRITKQFMSYYEEAKSPFFTSTGLEINPIPVALFDEKGKVLEIYDIKLLKEFRQKYNI